MKQRIAAVALIAALVGTGCSAIGITAACDGTEIIGMFEHYESEQDKKLRLLEASKPPETRTGPAPRTCRRLEGTPTALANEDSRRRSTSATLRMGRLFSPYTALIFASYSARSARA